MKMKKEKDMGTKQKIDLNSPKQNRCMDYHSPKWGGGGGK